MKTIILICTSLLFLIMYISKVEQNKELIRQNILLDSAANVVINFSDSTADTGEFDDFLDSESGTKFFQLYYKTYPNK